MSGPEAAAEARRWLRSAREDLQVGRIALGEDPPLVGPACVHSQQAAEKALKAARWCWRALSFPTSTTSGA